MCVYGSGTLLLSIFFVHLCVQYVYSRHVGCAPTVRKCDRERVCACVVVVVVGFSSSRGESV